MFVCSHLHTLSRSLKRSFCYLSLSHSVAIASSVLYYFSIETLGHKLTLCSYCIIHFLGRWEILMQSDVHKHGAYCFALLQNRDNKSKFAYHLQLFLSLVKYRTHCLFCSRSEREQFKVCLFQPSPPPHLCSSRFASLFGKFFG